MKSKIIKEIQKSEQITYPVLMQDTTFGAVVLFSSENKGVVVHGMGNYKMGYHYSHWTATNKEYWKKFQGTIEISN